MAMLCPECKFRMTELEDKFVCGICGAIKIKVDSSKVMFIVVDSVGLGDCYRAHSPEFVCGGCLDDDDEIVTQTVDVSCDRCGVSDLPY